MRIFSTLRRRACPLLRAVGLAFLFVVTARAQSGPADQPAPAASFVPKAGVFPDETITVGPEVREYRLVVPATVDLTKPAPLVFAFHGMGDDNKDHMPVTTGLNDLAAEHRFILVYPASGPIVTERGTIHGWALTPDRAAADLAFFDALRARLESRYRIDPAAVYLTGMSNGAYFAHLVAREDQDVVAAVAAHSGELGELDLYKLTEGRKFPVLMIHGDADPIFPVDGARHDAALYQATGHEVKLIIVPGLAHAWGPPDAYNEQIWNFFQSHRIAPAAAANATAPAPAPAATN
jgi:polyhydroxybutyrate depolymerase